MRLGDAHALDVPNETFDYVVMTLALCTIPNERQAIREAKRVLRPGGKIIALDHVRSPLLPVRLVQRLLDPLLVRWKADHLLREPLERIAVCLSWWRRALACRSEVRQAKSPFQDHVGGTDTERQEA